MHVIPDRSDFHSDVQFLYQQLFQPAHYYFFYQLYRFQFGRERNGYDGVFEPSGYVLGKIDSFNMQHTNGKYIEYV